MKKSMGKFLALILVGGAMASGNIAFGFAPEPELLKIKGFSPEIISVTETQRSRQEWRVPAPPRMSPMERFFSNIYYNDWIGNVDSFGDYIIRNRL